MCTSTFSPAVVWPGRRAEAGGQTGMLGAVIFDFDGVIADDELLHLAGFRQALASQGISVDQADYFARYVGFNDHDGFRAILADNRRQADSETVAGLMTDKARIFAELVSERVRIFPGVEQLLGRLRAGSDPLPTAIGSGALRSEIDLVLGASHLDGLFDVIVAADDVSRGKPDPETFIEASRRLEVGPERCIVIEDSTGGLEAAAHAGMRRVAVTNTYAAHELDAELVVTSLEELDRAALEALFDGQEK